ncbi:hypothetical protein [Paucibacter soli]|uniref:hypothetical protein n=1 Tax=Paucibacter soli TaxID=3133433 RepID=UPI00309A4862
MSTTKQMSYGGANAVKILAAERMGITVALSDLAKSLLRGEAVDPSAGVAIEREAVRLHNAIRKDGTRLPVANRHAQDVLMEYGFEIPYTSPGAVAPASRLARPGVH